MRIELRLVAEDAGFDERKSALRVPIGGKPGPGFERLPQRADPSMAAREPPHGVGKRMLESRQRLKE